jgi:hypothetical protein
VEVGSTCLPQQHVGFEPPQKSQMGDITKGVANSRDPSTPKNVKRAILIKEMLYVEGSFRSNCLNTDYGHFSARVVQELKERYET